MAPGNELQQHLGNAVGQVEEPGFAHRSIVRQDERLGCRQVIWFVIVIAANGREVAQHGPRGMRGRRSAAAARSLMALTRGQSRMARMAAINPLLRPAAQSTPPTPPCASVQATKGQVGQALPSVTTERIRES